MSERAPHVPFNDLSRALANDREQLVAAASAVIDSGWVIRGPQHSLFEEELAGYVGVRHAIGVSSGTDALQLAITASMPIGRSTVVTAANAGGYTTTATLAAGFSPVFADVDPATLCLDASTVARVLDDSVGVVVVTHLYGRVTDIGAIVRLCHDRGIRVLEDCAESIGARAGDRLGGSLGDIAAFSFYPTKNLGAVGDGGAVCTDDPELAARVRSLSQYGWGRKYHVESVGGRNSRLDEIQAAFLRTRLAGVEAGNRRRREIIRRYETAAAGGAIVVLPVDDTHAGHLAVALAEPGTRDAVLERLRDAGIATDVHFPVPDHRQPAWRALGGASLPVTEDACARVFSLPCFPELTDSEVEWVCVAIESLRGEL